MLDTTTLEPLRNTRVRVSREGETYYEGQLRGIRPDFIYVDEIRFDILPGLEVSEAPLTCPNCKRSTLTLTDDLCAECYREEARHRPAHQESCEDCGAPGFRNPGSNHFYCTMHHADRGHAVRLTHAEAHLLASCATEDTDSPNHEWRQVKGARFRCIRCQKAEKYDAGLLKSLSK